MSSSSSSTFSQLLEGTLLPIPSFQRLAVVSIFEKLRSDPSLDLDRGPARDALSRCLTSPSPAVLEQSARELCRLPLPPSRALLELLSALDASPSPFLVRAIGYVSRIAFRNDPATFHLLLPSRRHPLVMVLSCRYELCDEVLRQLLLFVAQNISSGVDSVSEFLHPVIAFSVLKITSSAQMGLFVKDLFSSIAATACSFPSEGMSMIDYLMDYLKFFPCRDEKDVKLFLCCTEYLVEAFVEVSKQSIGVQKFTSQTKTCCLHLLEALVSVSIILVRPFGGSDFVSRLSQCLLVAYRELDQDYPSEFVMVTLSLSTILSQLELEHEQLSMLKLLIYIIQWKSESQSRGKTSFSIQEFQLLFPAVNLLSSPSNAVKVSATYLLSMLERCLLDSLVNISEVESSYVDVLAASKPEVLVSRFLHHIWFEEQTFQQCVDVFDIISSRNPSLDHRDNKLLFWIFDLTGKQFTVAENLNSRNMPQSTVLPILRSECILLSIVSTILVVHPKIGGHAAVILNAVCRMDPRANMPLFMSILFYFKIFCSSDCSPGLLLRFIEMLPPLASHSLMVPLIVHTILPMLKKNLKPALNAVGIRLLCKTWAVADKCFGSLQEALEKEKPTKLGTERDLSVSIAASVCDVCKCNPDRGVDLIECVSSCIESDDPTVQAFGLESLSHLCGADVVDFYTAWNVIAKSTQNYTVSPVVARSLARLLRWGALDSEAYPDDSKNVIHVLWDIGTSQNSQFKSMWSQAKVAAFESLVHYEVGIIKSTIEDFDEQNICFLINEDNQDVLKALVQFEVNIINFEYINRRRLIKNKRPMVHKIQKLLDLLPQAILNSEKCAREYPASLLLLHSFTPKEIQKKGSPKDLPTLQMIYENKLLEVAECLQLPRNNLCALLALQSWKAFVTRWMSSTSLVLKSKSQVTDTNLQAAKEILEILCRCAESSIPRVSENIILAIGAFCTVLKPSASSVVSNASDFLSKWLLQFEHEHMQWSAAISLGLLSNYLHVTDRIRKFVIVSNLLKVILESRSFFVKGACGIGLGFACQDLLTTTRVEGNFNLDGSIIQNEVALLGKIVRNLCLLIASVHPPSSRFLESIVHNFPMETVGAVISNPFPEKNVVLEESSVEVCGISGVIIGLGQTIGAIYRLGAHDAVLKIKDFLLSCIPILEQSPQSYLYLKFPLIAFSVGACIVLPTVAAFCEKVELVHNETYGILSVYKEMVTDLLAAKKSGHAHQHLLMASCFGAGTLLSCTLGMQGLKIDDVTEILKVIRTAYLDSKTPIVAFGGMLGVMNGFGADAGLLADPLAQSSFSLGNYSQETMHVSGPILASHALVPFSTSIIQELFMLAKDSENPQIKGYAAWALSSLRYKWWSREFPNVNEKESDSQNFSDESVVLKLYLWLLHLQNSEVNIMMHMHTVVVVFSCLKKAPRIPVSSDWGRIVRYCMKHAAPSGSWAQMEVKLVREECVSFCMQHANNVDSLLLFLDEIMDFPRFSRLEEALQLSLLKQLFSVMKVFHESRQQKLFAELIDFFSLPNSSYMAYEPHQRCLMRVYFWKGLFQCLDELPDTSNSMLGLESCMETLFHQLPVFLHGGIQDSAKEEWSAAVKCLAISRLHWLMNLLQVGVIKHEMGGRFSSEVMRRVLAITRLVSIGHIQISELGMLKNYIFHFKAEGSWRMLIEVAVAVAISEGSCRHQWLIDALDISIVSSYPSVALQFIGILAGICCKYRPLLVIDPDTVLRDLSVTLPSLLSESSWASVKEPLAAKLWLLTNRLCTWVLHLKNGDDMPESVDGVDPSENALSGLLVDVMLQTCLSFKDHLPFENQLKLVDLLTSRT